MSLQNNPSNAEASFVWSSDSFKASKPCLVGIHCIVLAEYSRMSTHMPGFVIFFRILHHLVLAKLDNSSIRVMILWWIPCTFPCRVSVSNVYRSLNISFEITWHHLDITIKSLINWKITHLSIYMWVNILTAVDGYEILTVYTLAIFLQ